MGKLKPNGIARTVYPEQPCQDYNEWMQHITAKSIERDADQFKSRFELLWNDFKKDIVKHYGA